MALSKQKLLKIYSIQDNKTLIIGKSILKYVTFVNMLDTNSFIARLKTILKHNELSSAGFADLIKVQRSSISHLLNGRNKPSLEFIMKVTEAFEEIDLQWLVYGTGKYPSENLESKKEATTHLSHQFKSHSNNNKIIDRIVIFFSDGTFKSYNKQ